MTTLATYVKAKRKEFGLTQGSKSYMYSNGDFSHNEYKISDKSWEKIERAGVVFLPAAGWRGRSIPQSVGQCGYYWSSTPYDNDKAYDVRFDGNLYPTYQDLRNSGFSVRLVR